MTIGQRIKHLREQHGMTQSELASIAGVTDKAVSTWENGVNIPRMGVLQRMADYFNVTKSYIMGEDDDGDTKLVSGKAHASAFTDDEVDLINIYRELNPKGQRLVVDYSLMIVSNPDYRQEGPSALEK